MQILRKEGGEGRLTWHLGWATFFLSWDREGQQTLVPPWVAKALASHCFVVLPIHRLGPQSDLCCKDHHASLQTWSSISRFCTLLFLSSKKQKRMLNKVSIEMLHWFWAKRKVSNSEFMCFVEPSSCSTAAPEKQKK